MTLCAHPPPCQGPTGQKLAPPQPKIFLAEKTAWIKHTIFWRFQMIYILNNRIVSPGILELELEIILFLERETNSMGERLMLICSSSSKHRERKISYEWVQGWCIEQSCKRKIQQQSKWSGIRSRGGIHTLLQIKGRWNRESLWLMLAIKQGLWIAVWSYI